MASRAQEATLEELVTCFQDLEDPGSEVKRMHSVVSIVSIRVMAWEQHVRCRHCQQPADRHEGRRSLPSPASPAENSTELKLLLCFLPCCVLRGAVGGAKKHRPAGSLS